ncbi:hypothetical protein FB45DRAFT_1104466 [Roridomyces roridus]|uniref:HD domain-containing protein n=1 Tax=Roridomyces roridus TaxID=1738132 RepID=A0AAD7BCG0_9AGAR|nr:hypothetical protein FB45DRAFT_1104466 [Roridomyces roridus]
MVFSSTYDAFVPSNYTQFFSLGIQPHYVPFNTLNASFIPDLAQQASFTYAKRFTPPTVFLHCLRVFYFGLAMLYNGFPSQTPGVAQISFNELSSRFYHAAVLHDIAWSSDPIVTADPAHGMTFEMQGAFMSYAHLHLTAPAYTAEQVGDIAESITLHTSTWAGGNSSATQILLAIAVDFDAVGYDAFGPGSLDFLVNRTTVAEIEAQFPRGDLAAEIIQIMEKQFEEKPNSLLSHFPGGPEGFYEVLRVPPIVD